MDHVSDGSGWQEYGDEIIKQKHITPTHFTWFHYNKEEDRLIGMGGGTYFINDDGKYVENIDFFYPPASSELGQSIPFDVTVENGIWYHTGYAKQMEINGNGLIIAVDSVKIEEKWSPVTTQYKNDNGLIGAWDLDTYRYETESPYLDYPEYMGYLKLLTPTHFIWIQYNKQADEIYGSGSGMYSYNSEKYVEILEMTHPANSNAKNATITFDIELNNSRWKHFGYLPTEEGKPDGPDNRIDEFWVPHKMTPEEELLMSN